MCGIFGFALKQPRSMKSALDVLEKLEAHQYPREPKPVGGYGAGVAILTDDGHITCHKAGKSKDASPVKHLAETLRIKNASVLIGHVRMPSPEFMDTARFREAAQPYIVHEDHGLSIASVHNGKVQNYRKLRAKLGKSHVFESEKTRLIDSEVIPHLFGELCQELNNDKALYALFCALHGSSAIGILQADKRKTYLHIIHKGKTRGLTIWTNAKNEVIFCSRKEPMTDEFRNILAEEKFAERISIPFREDAGLKLSFPVKFG